MKQAILTLFQDCIATFLAILKNRSILLTMVLSIGFYGIFYPTAYHAQHAQALPLIIVDEEQSALSHTIIRTTSHSPNVEVIDITNSLPQALKQVRSMHAEGILYLPKTLSQSIHHGETGGIGLYLSGAYLLRTQTVSTGLISSLEQVLIDEMAKFTQISHLQLPTLVHKQPLFNTTSGYGSYVFPAIAPLIVHQTLLLGVGMLICGFQQTHRRLRISQLISVYLVAGMIGTLSSWYLYGFVFWQQDYPRGGNFWGMVLATPIFIGAVIAIASALSSFFDRSERVGQLLIFSSVPLFLLSGLAYPFVGMPKWLVSSAELLPSTQGIQMFVQLNQMGVPTQLIAPKLFYLFAVMLIMSLLALWRLCLKPSLKPNDQQPTMPTNFR